MMRRREFITLLGGAAVAWPVAARAQQPAMPTIGFLGTQSPGPFASRLRAFREGLGEAGFVEGQNVAIEYRWADGQNEQLLPLATDLVRREVSVIVTGGVPGARAAKAATTAIPVVFIMASDPVELGFVASLNRPAGNLTGVTNLGAELGPKRLQLLHELVPAATVIALLVNPTNPSPSEVLTRDAQSVAGTLGLKLHVLHASSEAEFAAVFANVITLGAAGLVITSDGFLLSRDDQLGALSVRHAVPTVFQNRAFAEAGGLMSYGASSSEGYRLNGIYAGRILKGEKPSELPVQQATKFELVINLKTAKALGLTIPLPLLARADEVIE